MTRPALRLDAATLAAAVAALSARDPDLARIHETHGLPPPRDRPPGFSSLLGSIVGQQVSVQSARAVWTRLEQALGEITPAAIFAADETVLRGCGFSGQKLRYAKGLAAALIAGELDLEALEALDDEAAIEALVRLKGIGRWTAEMYLIFALGRPDVMPVADIGIIVALQHLKGLSARPHAAELLALAEAWRPWRSAACLMLWHYRHNMPGSLSR